MEAMTEAGYRASTINRDISQIGSIYKWAARKRMTPPGFRSPTAGIERLVENLRVIHLSGHTAGSVAVVYDDPNGHPHLFTGDSLFPGGIGNTQGDQKRFTSLINDVESKIFARLPDETWVYPGHGRDTTLGAERPALPAWRARGW